MKTGALIVASLSLDSESRSNEDMTAFLPMQHLEGTTVIKREISILRKAGITPIIVLCGYQMEVLKNHLIHNGVIFCEDRRFEEHGFDETLEVGLSFAERICDRVIIVPVECPVFSGKTVENLAKCRESTIPVYQGKAGWPGLCVFGKKTKVLKEADSPDFYSIDDWKKTALRLDTEDTGILYSLTDADGYGRVQVYARQKRQANVLQMKLKVMLTKEEDFFGPGVYHLLRNIDETGSIQAAAGKMQMSYSKCWKMINKAEAQMGFKFVDRVNGGKHGGSSTLTEDARVFLDRYKALTEDIGRMSQNFFDVYFRDFQ
ncbi:MAG: LysR family transcriptional regulator [Eubacteriales bacterium]|nr:LysR family transcriptional regulator [Eubacteriales bacterium]